MTKNQATSKFDGTVQDRTRMLREREQQRQQIIAANKQASMPVLADLAKVGYQVEWIEDLFNKRIHYKDAIPILLHWLPKIDNLDVKEAIVRALSVPWARPVAAPVLVDEFHRLENESNTGIKWAIANALSVVADDGVFESIVNLVRDPRHGKSREMLAVALGNMRNPQAQDVLIDLLDDDEVVGHAIIALGKLKSKKAYPAIERFATHPKAWIRKEAKKALARIEKSST